MADGLATPPASIQGLQLALPEQAPDPGPLLDAGALELLAELHRRFDSPRRALLAARRERQSAFDAGQLPDFRAETRALREGDWTVAPLPPVLLDRRVEITGPVDRKMIVNALNSGARVFMADFEDSTAPSWGNLLDGQRNLFDAVRRQIDFTAPGGKHYALKADGLATLMVRPRGWHLPEKHVLVDGERMSAALFDAGLFLHHNAAVLAERGEGPFLYLPKLEAFEEAALWDEVLAFLEVRAGLPIGTTKVTVLVETLPAVFQMHEILHALRGRAAGLNCGRWDYIFSYLKTFRRDPWRVLPERGQVGMTVPFLKAYSELLIQTCHRRGALAMGGMAAQIPIAGDPEAHEEALARVRADKLREVAAGHDGTWVAHPGLIPVAQAVFDAHMPGPNQLHELRRDVRADRDLLLEPSSGSITRAGFLANIDVCVRYLAAWLDAQGCVPLHHLMEDAATAEIARAQLWQWTHCTDARLDDGTPVTLDLFDQALAGVHDRLPADALPGRARIAEAAAMLRGFTHDDDLADFLTLAAYERLP